MEARLARVESDVAHLMTDVADVKADIRSLRDRMDDGFSKLNDKIDGLNDKFGAKLQTLQDSVVSTRESLSESISTAKVWALVLYIALTAAIFGTMARGFGWI